MISDPSPSIGLIETPARHKALNRYLQVCVNHDDPGEYAELIRNRSAIGPDQQRKIKHHDSIAARKQTTPSLDLVIERRVNYLTQGLQFVGVVEGDLRYSTPIQLAVRCHNCRAPTLNHCLENRLARFLQLTHNPISVDQHRPPIHEGIGNSRFT